MNKSGNYNHTILACYTGYIVQAAVNNFAPLLFLTFQTSYQIGWDKIALITTVNFIVQLLVDLLSAKLIDRIGYRVTMVGGHLFSVLGFLGMAFLPGLLPDPYLGLLIAVVLYAVGGGVMEVLVSPIVEACPTQNKEAAMSLLHSFYCWGQVGVVLLSTLYFRLFGIGNWKILACIWAILPFINMIVFCRVPIRELNEGETGMKLRELFSLRLFWIFMLLMVCAGACELGMSQWASAFAESGLGVNKAVGDLAGPCMFAVLMGLARVLSAKYAERIVLSVCMAVSALLCFGCYLLAGLSPVPLLGLLGCAVCGFSVGILWPGTFSMAAARIRRGGTAMFAMFALAGDLGCAAGPTLIGLIADRAPGGLRSGVTAGVIFPLLLLIALCLLRCEKNDGQKS